MTYRFLFAAALAALPAASPALAADESAGAGAATAATTIAAPATAVAPQDGIPAQLDEVSRTGYRIVFAAIREQRWADARIQLDAMKPGPLHPIATAELYLAKDSPRVELDPILALLAQAPELPQAEQLARLAQTRGAVDLPPLPYAQRLVWYDAAPVRRRARSVLNDTAAALLAAEMKPLIKADNGPGAEMVLAKYAADLAPESVTEWQQKIAWIYFVSNDDVNARRYAALAQGGTGEWAAQGDWVQGLAAWRQRDCRGAQAAFNAVAQRATDTELRSAGLYWTSRADMACAQPERVQGHLQSAAQYGETFYGLLARQALGIVEPRQPAPRLVTADWAALERRPNVRVAAALVEIGENKLADQLLRQQAKLSPASEHAALTGLASQLNLPATELWLSHNGPAGARPVTAARYPSPNWTPDGGWRVDKALVFAHTLQESRFDNTVVSRAGAFGLMQIMPAAASDIARRRGTSIGRDALTRPSTNMEVGQSYLEQLRDQPFTGGLLLKVIAAYNAGPTPVEAWNSLTRDNGDPLLYLEAIPYWETRGYVMTVLRNYWMYESQEGRASPSRAALAQGLWPKFPGMQGASAVKIPARPVLSVPVYAPPAQAIAPRAY